MDGNCITIWYEHFKFVLFPELSKQLLQMLTYELTIFLYDI